MSLTVETIIGLNIKEGVLASDLILRINWRDTNLMWDKIIYEKNLINVELQNIWYPNIQICNTITGKFRMDTNKAVIINSEGYIHLYIDEIFKTYCRLNVEKYLYDEYECDLLICFEHLMHMEETISGFQYDIAPKSTSKQWNFKFRETKTGNMNSTAVGLTVHSSRKINSAPVTKTILLIMLTLLVFSVHLLPVDSGEKI